MNKYILNEGQNFNYLSEYNIKDATLFRVLDKSFFACDYIVIKHLNYKLINTNNKTYVSFILEDENGFYHKLSSINDINTYIDDNILDLVKIDEHYVFDTETVKINLMTKDCSYAPIDDYQGCFYSENGKIYYTCSFIENGPWLIEPEKFPTNFRYWW